MCDSPTSFETALFPALRCRIWAPMEFDGLPARAIGAKKNSAPGPPAASRAPPTDGSCGCDSGSGSGVFTLALGLFYRFLPTSGDYNP